MMTQWILNNLAIESMLYSFSHLLAPFALNSLESKTESLAFHIGSIGSVGNLAFNAKDYMEDHSFVKRLNNEETDVDEI